MNDRHRYRAFAKYSKVMYYDEEDLSITPMGMISYENSNKKLFFAFDNNEIVMQCTGLKDKSGKLIYEGDIVKYTHDTGHTNTTSIYSEDYQWRLSGTMLPFSIFAKTYIEVIGNIYENPELLNTANSPQLTCDDNDQEQPEQPEYDEWMKRQQQEYDEWMKRQQQYEYDKWVKSLRDPLIITCHWCETGDGYPFFCTIGQKYTECDGDDTECEDYMPKKQEESPPETSLKNP